MVFLLSNSSVEGLQWDGRARNLPEHNEADKGADKWPAEIPIKTAGHSVGVEHLTADLEVTG